VRHKSHTPAPGAAAAPPMRWRDRLRRHLAALLLMKVVALALLWVLFFSPAHHARVDAAAVSRHLLPAKEVPQ
jgi:uncharacterized membrane protein